MNNLLVIVQEAATALSLPAPTAVVGSGTASDMLWLTLAKREGQELARRHDWQALIVQKTWTADGNQAQALAIGTDYDHLMPDVEIWNRTLNQRYIGPVTSVDWMRLQSGISGGVTGWWRLIGNTLTIYPAPTSGQSLAWEYISRNWCQSSGSTAQSTWLADTDTPLIPDRLISLGLTWRWLKSKGMDYAEDMATYEREVERAASRDRGLRVMAVGKARTENYPPQPSWTGVIST